MTCMCVISVQEGLVLHNSYSISYTMAHIQGIHISSMESNPNPKPILFHTVLRD